VPVASSAPRRPAGRAVACVAVVALAGLAPVGCNALAGVSDLHVVGADAADASDVGVADLGPEVAPDADAQAIDATDASDSSDAPDAADAPDAVESGPPVSCATYVDSLAAASGDGTRDKPFRTIGAALAVAPAGGNVCVCAGTYGESVRLTGPWSLLGGFSRTTWTRPVDYGFPSFASSVKTEVIGVDAPALTIDGPVIGRATRIDGFTFTGPSTVGDASSIGVQIVSGSPTFTNDVARGGAASASTSMGSVGLMLNAGSAEVAWNRILGGSGSSYTYGSVGLWIDPGAADAPYVHDNVIDGGTGTRTGGQGGGFTTIGVYFGGNADYTVAQGNAFERNTISGGAGTCVDGSLPTNGGYGVLAVMAGGHLELRHDGIEGGATSGAGSRTWGVYLLGLQGHYLLAGDRIDGGAHQAAAIGVAVDDVVIEDDYIHGGRGTDGYGVWVEASRCTIRQTVILAPPASSGGLSGAIGIGKDTVTGTVVENDVLGGIGIAGDAAAIVSSTCASGGPFASVRNNVVFGFTRGLFGYGASLGTATDPGCAPLAWLSDVPAAESELSTYCTSTTSGACASFGGALAGSNRVIAASCAGKKSCITIAACTDGASCWGALFSPWTASSTGYGDLFPFSGAPSPWTPRKGAPCVLTQGGLDLSAVDPVDYAGTARSAGGTHSVGALQLVDPTCVP
jgi:hypothetical protein